MARLRLLPALRLTLLVACGITSGCAVGPDFQRPSPPTVTGYTATPSPVALAASGETTQRLALGQKIESEWWRLFGSDDLNRVLTLAIAGSPTLEASRARLSQAREQIAVAAGGLYPQIDAGAGVTRSQAPRSSTGKNGAISNSYSFSTPAIYDVDIFGGTRRSVEQAGALAEFQRYELAAAYLTLTGNVITQAITIASIRAQILAVNDLIALDRHNLELTQTAFAGGRSARSDVLAAQSQLTSDLTQLPTLDQQLAAARHALSVLIGQAPVEWSPPDFDLDAFTSPTELPVAVPSSLVRQRPDILAAEATLHASSAAIGIATANLYPSLTLSATWSRTGAYPAALFDPANAIWSIAASISAPLFRGGALNAERRAAADQFQADLAAYRDTVLQSFGQVADVLRALEHDAQLLDAQKAATESAQASVDLIQESYRVGQANLLQVLDAQRLLFQARLGFVRVKAQRFQDSALLFEAMGGDWTSYREAAP